MWQLLSALRIVLLICVIRRIESCYDIVEKGQPAGFQCTFSFNPTIITYQVLSGNSILNLTTCNMVSRTCTDQQPSVYQGQVLSSVQGNYTMELIIKSVRINETRFRCVIHRGDISNECKLEVYVWPTPPVCEPMKLDSKNMSLELTCTSSNVYPAFSAQVYWSPPVVLDIDMNNHVCTVSDIGSGSLGDASETCTWHIHVSTIPEGVYVFYITASALVTNSTAVTKSPVRSQYITADLRVPYPVIYSKKCPVGSGVVGDYIEVGTSATCTCDVGQIGLLSGQAQWFTEDGRPVGVNNLNDRSSTLTLSYNSSDPDVTYKCRATNPINQHWFVTYKPMFPSPDCHMIVEKGQSTQIDCPFQIIPNTLTWQVWTGEEYVPVSTCSSIGTCVDHMSKVYKGHFVYASVIDMFTLDISSVTTNETRFRCVTDNMKVAKICTLEPYRWPSTITYGGMQLVNKFVEVTFSSIVYPNVQATLHRRNAVLSTGDVESGYCSLNKSSNEENTDYIATCTWRIPISKMLLSNTFYVEMSVPVTNPALVNRSPVFSNDTIIQLDPNPTYECRGINPTRDYPSTTYQPQFVSTGCHVIVEKGQSTHLECPVQGSINTLAWQVWTHEKYVQVSTCPLFGYCADHMSQVYSGDIRYSSGVRKFILDIGSVRSNETQFRCLTDEGNVVQICTLEPYRWPSIPIYEGTRVTNQSVEITYSSVAYPNIDAILHRRNTFMSKDDVESSYCSLNKSSIDPNSDYIATCTWLIPISKMLLSNTFYVEMFVPVTNQTLVNRSPVFSNDTIIRLVTVILHNCPSGPGVTGEEISKGTFATCTCIAPSNGFFNTVQARWFNAHEDVVGLEDSSVGSSTLTVSFNPLDPRPTYECRGLNPTRDYPSITYQPKFVSSSHGSATTGMLFVLVVCAGLSSTVY